MLQAWLKSGRIDRLAVGLSGLCLAHCLITSIVVALLASVSSFFLSPLIHELGLALAILLGAIGLGHGARAHGSRQPLAMGILGLAIMAAALAFGHGWHEAPMTVLGVTILAAAHILNYRASR